MASSSHIHFFNPAFLCITLLKNFLQQKTYKKRFPKNSLPKNKKPTRCEWVGCLFLLL